MDALRENNATFFLGSSGPSAVWQKQQTCPREFPYACFNTFLCSIGWRLMALGPIGPYSTLLQGPWGPYRALLGSMISLCASWNVQIPPESRAGVSSLLKSQGSSTPTSRHAFSWQHDSYNSLPILWRKRNKRLQT